MKNQSERFIERLKKLKNLQTDTDLADALGVSRGAIASWKKQNNVNIMKILHAFPNVSIDELLDIEDKKKCTFENYIKKNIASYTAYQQKKNDLLQIKEQMKDVSEKQEIDELLRQMRNLLKKEIESELSYKLMKFVVDDLK